MNDLETIRLKIPRQELDSSTFFGSDASTAKTWVANLPITNIGQTTRLLFQALSELNRVRMLPKHRLEILEQLRTPIYFISGALSKHYLNQSVVLAEQPQKVVELDHSLHQHLAMGYTIVATHLIALNEKSKLTNSKAPVSQALHRVITELCVNMRRHFQVYEPVNKDQWHSLHQFYCLAKQQNVLDQRVEDLEFGNCSVEDSYIRALLLGTCKPNQLRQDDLQNIFKPLAKWASHCRLGPCDSDSFFTIDPNSDNPAVYKELVEDETIDTLLGLETKSLCDYLQDIRAQANPGSLNLMVDGQFVSSDLLGHLILSWGAISKRTFMRLEANEVLEMCIGLSAVHHFLSDQIDFEQLIDEPGAEVYSIEHENPFLKIKSETSHRKDIWDSPYEANLGQTNVALESIDYHIRGNAEKSRSNTEKYRSHNTRMVNSSSNGYCIQWPSEAVAPIRTGEIVGIKEVHSQNWSVAVIRWVSRDESNQIQIGLKIISPTALPFGTRVIQRVGADHEYMRTLLLPEDPSTQQPLTLLTSRVPFRSGQKVMLTQHGKRRQIRLGKKLNESGAYNLFEVERLIKPTNSNVETQNSEFESLWGKL